MPDGNGEMIHCPQCVFQDDLSGFDCLGACEDNVFCPNCFCEFDPVTGKVHECTTDPLDAANVRESTYECNTEGLPL